MKKFHIIPALALAALLAATPSAHAVKASQARHASARSTSATKAKTATFAVSKMDCEGCASGLVQAAKGWAGVKSANVSFAQKRALVTFDPKKTSSAKIAKEFGRIGFPAKVVQ